MVETIIHENLGKLLLYFVKIKKKNEILTFNSFLLEKFENEIKILNLRKKLGSIECDLDCYKYSKYVRSKI